MTLSDIPEEKSKSPVVIIGAGDHDLAMDMTRIAMEKAGHEVVTTVMNDQLINGNIEFEEQEGLDEEEPGIRKRFGTIGHVNHGLSNYDCSSSFKKSSTDALQNVDNEDILKFSTMQSSYLSLYSIYLPLNTIEESLEYEYYSDPLRKKYRKSNNSQTPNNSKKKKKQSKQARKKNRKK